ncbi:hypothetical protein ACIPPS_30120 [Streptomyces sp. NPDC090127]
MNSSPSGPPTAWTSPWPPTASLPSSFSSFSSFGSFGLEWVMTWKD